MKAKISLLFIFLSGLIRAQYQQSNFIIGADWLNSFRQDRVDNIVPMSPRYWELIDSLNLNFGTIACLDTSLTRIQNIRTILDDANNHTKKIELNIVAPPLIEAIQIPPYGYLQRWMFQIEGDIDFKTHDVGVSAPEDSAELHWSLVKDKDPHPNCWYLDTNYYRAGYAAKDFKNFDTIPDGNNYYMKIKLKKMGNDFTNNPVIKVSLINNLHSSIRMDTTLKANDLPNDT